MRAGALLAALAVGLGAFGAHGIDWTVAGRNAATFETAARYHVYHALALVLCALLADRGRRTAFASGCFGAGIAFFAGPLYVLALGGPKWLGAIAPIGGTLMIVGWIALAFSRPAPKT